MDRKNKIKIKPEEEEVPDILTKMESKSLIK